MQSSTIRPAGPLLPGEHPRVTLEALRTIDTLTEIRALDMDTMHDEPEPIDPATTAAAIRSALRLGALDELPDLIGDVSELSEQHDSLLAPEQRARQAWLELEAAALELAAALEAIAD